MCDCCLEHMRNSQQQVYVGGIKDIESFARLENKIAQLPGILMSEYLPATSQARLTYDARVTAPDKIQAEINDLQLEILI